MAQFESVIPLHPLLQDVAKQTNPDNFMNPYDAVKVKRAMELNHQTYVTNIGKPLRVLKLIETTIKELGCEYSAEQVYSYLLSMYKPTRNRANFDKYNELCQNLYEVKDDISAMTTLLDEALQKEQQEKKTAAMEQRKKRYEENKEMLKSILAAIGITLLAVLIIVVALFRLQIGK